MTPYPILLAVLLAPAAHAYACLDPADPTGRRWFQDDPCPPGWVDSPLPPTPLVNNPWPPEYRFLPGWPATEGSRVWVGRHWHGWHGRPVVVYGARGPVVGRRGGRGGR